MVSLIDFDSSTTANFDGVLFLLQTLSIEHEVIPVKHNENRLVRFKKDGIWWIIEQYKEEIEESTGDFDDNWTTYGLALYEEGKRPELMTKITRGVGGYFSSAKIVIIGLRRA